MRGVAKKLLLVSAAAVAVQAVRRKAAEAESFGPGSGGSGGSDAVQRALAITVNCPPQRLDPLPEPLAELGDDVEIVIREAPGSHGTEVLARLRDTPPAGLLSRAAGGDPRQDVRLALRRTKSLVETGEVLHPDYPPTTHRTVLGAPLELATRRGREEGRL
jgi:hypothetical protein